MSQVQKKRIVSAVTVVAAAGTRVPVIAAGTPYNTHVQSVTIRALSTNGGNIFVGDSTVAAAGPYYVLTPGEPVTISVDWNEWKYGACIDLSQIWIDSAVNGEGVCLIYIQD